MRVEATPSVMLYQSSLQLCGRSVKQLKLIYRDNLPPPPPPPPPRPHPDTDIESYKV